MAKISAEEIKKAIPETYATTSIPASQNPKGNYVHQVDVIFKTPLPEDKKEFVNKIVYMLRNSILLNVETPQWWDEESAPEATEAEKSNWTARLMAFIGLE